MEDQKPPEETPARNIHEAIVQIYGACGYVQKRKSPNLTYTFAGERELIQALRPEMEERGVLMYVAEYLDVAHTVGQTSTGKQTNITTCRAVVRFLHAPSGTFIDVQALGEGSDSSDKSGNKAMTCAFKYAMRQTFCIETGDDPDATQGNDFQRGAQPASKPAQATPAAAKPTTPAPQTQSAPAGKPAAFVETAKTADALIAAMVKGLSTKSLAELSAAYTLAQKNGASKEQLDSLRARKPELSAPVDRGFFDEEPPPVPRNDK